MLQMNVKSLSERSLLTSESPAIAASKGANPGLDSDCNYKSLALDNMHLEKQKLLIMSMVIGRRLGCVSMNTGRLTRSQPAQLLPMEHDRTVGALRGEC